MRRYEINDEQWEKIKDKLPCQPGYQGKSVDNRLFINALMFVARCGIPWRDLPERFGNWNTVSNFVSLFGNSFSITERYSATAYILYFGYQIGFNCQAYT